MSELDFAPNPLDEEDEGPEGRRRVKIITRAVIAAVIIIVAFAAECMVMVPADEAVVISRLGNPIRVLTKPGLSWKLPAPIETTVPIDLRLRTTSTGLQDVGTRDGLRVLLQTYTAWQVRNDPADIRQFLRALRNQPEEAARQLRSFASAGMHIASSNFLLTDLVNSDPNKVQLGALEDQLKAQIADQMRKSYGIEIRQVGVERLTLPAATLTATVSRMSAERETVAAARTADGLRLAAQIQADADRDARQVVATAKQNAARIQSDAEVKAAAIYARAYRADPGLYTTLRSLDTVGKVVGPNTNIVLRTDAAPFRVLSDGPTASGAAASAHKKK
jgi:membrane protease subunit HflC